MYATRCCASIHYESYELTFPLQNGSFIRSTLMAAAAVKTGEPIQRRGASYCDSQPPNCSFEVITRQVRAISSTMPETNEGGRARLMRSKSRGRLPAWVPGAPKKASSLKPWKLSAPLWHGWVLTRGVLAGKVLDRDNISLIFFQNRWGGEKGQSQRRRRAKHIVLLSRRKIHSRGAE